MKSLVTGPMQAAFSGTSAVIEVAAIRPIAEGVTMPTSTTNVHVSPNGDDAWSGRLSEPNTGRTDGPLRTLEAAQKAVRRLKSGLNEPMEIRVLLRGGTYELAQPWLFTAQDSGFPRGGKDLNPNYAGRLAQSWPVVWAAYPNETPVISGGRRLTGVWQTELVHGRTAWVTTIPEVAQGRWYFRQLWVNGQRRNRPCLPKKGVWQVDRALDADYDKFYLNAGSQRFGFKEGELSAAWHNLQDIELQFFGWWVAPRVGLAAVDEAERVASFDRNSMLRLAWSEGDGVDYRVENVFEALTEPGEWYLDRTTGKLTYLPLPGEDMATAEVFAPQIETLLCLDGAENVRFEGLTFSCNEWRAPEHFSDSTQASREVPGAIILRRTINCGLRNCRILHTNSYGVELVDGTTETALEQCELRDLGAGGVKIWHGCRRNVVSDCEIANGGLVYPAGVGILIGKSSGNRIERNHIHDLFYSGISVGWTWGYGEGDAYANLIEGNHIHHIGKGLLSDMGGIYLLGPAPGTRLRYNRIHDITCRRYGGWGIYTDEGSSDVLIECNLAFNVDRNPFNQHYGRNNRVVNNIFAYGGDAVLSYSKQEPHLGVTFERNILVSRGKPILRKAKTTGWTVQQTIFQHNLFWREDGPVVFNCEESAIYASQAFPKGFKAEASRFAPLERGLALTRFVNQSGKEEAPVGAGDLRIDRQGDALIVCCTFKRPAIREVLSGSIWEREHMELFLKPFPGLPGMVQLALASDSEATVIWHDCSAPADFKWKAEVKESEEDWQATLRIPLDVIAAAVGGTGVPQWSFLAAFVERPESGDWAWWQAQGHDSAGVVADPLFVDPLKGDFRLRPESPALKMGFVAFEGMAP